VHRLLAEDPGAYCPTRHNPDNVAAYEPSLRAAHPARQHRLCLLGRTGGHSAVSPRCYAAPAGLRLMVSTPSAQRSLAAFPTAAHASLGSSIYPTNVDYQPSTRSTGSAAEAVWRVEPWPHPATPAAAGASGSRVVAVGSLVTHAVARRRILPDAPQRYFDTVYNNDYCEAHGYCRGADPRAARSNTRRTTGRSVTRCTTVIDPVRATVGPAGEQA